MLIDVNRKTISIMKAARLCDVGRRTIYHWLEQGKVEYVRTAGGSVRIYVDTLFVEPSAAHTKQPTTDTSTTTYDKDTGECIWRGEV